MIFLLFAVSIFLLSCTGSLKKTQPPATDEPIAELPEEPAAFDTPALPKKSGVLNIPQLELPELRDTIRVGLIQKAREIAISSSGSVSLRDSDGGETPLHSKARGRWTVKLLPAGVALFENGSSEPLAIAAGELVIRSNNKLNTINVEGHSYRGIIRVNRNSRAGLDATNHLLLEDYVRGVLPYEMPAKDVSILEALKAQAVAARTYAIVHLNQYAKLHFDVYSDVKDQVYRGIKAETYLSDKAAVETQGVVLTYKGTLARCYYHSTCGGKTSAIQDIWRGAPVPYLVSQADVDEQGRLYDADTGWKRWKMQWEREELVYILNQFLKSAGVKTFKPFKNIKDIKVESRNPCGRVKSLAVTTEKETLRIRSDKTRWALRQPEPPHNILPSSWFKFDHVGKAIIISGKGLGHGIGMCQTGAMGRAHSGQTFDQILYAYYAGTELMRI